MKRVHHKNEEYVRGDAHTIEGFFSIFKRGMKGVYQHCSEAHLQRYLTEFDFRYSNRAKLGVSDDERALKALKGMMVAASPIGGLLEGKRSQRRKKLSRKDFKAILDLVRWLEGFEGKE